MRWAYILFFIILCSVIIYYFYFLQNEKYKVKAPLDSVNSTLSKEKKVLYMDKKEYRELDFKPKPKEAERLWKLLQKVGFNSPDTLAILDELWYVGGAKIYYKELREAVRDSAVNDKVTAYIIEMLAGAYETGAEGMDIRTNYALPKSRKDEIIQELIKEQIQNPRGKESLKMALNKIGYAYNHDEAQEILDGFLTSEQSLVSHEEIYKIKLSLAAMHPQSNSLRKVLSQVQQLPNKSQKEIFPEILNDSQWVPTKDDDKLRKEYFEYVKNHMPKKPYSANIDYDLVMNQTLQEFGFDEETLNSYSEEERKKFLSTIAPKIYKRYDEKIAELTKDNNYQLYEDSINALIQTMITKQQDYYISAKKLFIQSDDPTYKQTILSLLVNEVNDYEDRIKQDIEIKNALLNEIDNQCISKRDRNIFESYYKSFFGDNSEK